ncbi:MAG: flavin monoamine oxidase family protein [Halorientalis sp.]
MTDGRGSGAGSTGAGLRERVRSQSRTDAADERDLDVAVVGAGASGLYTAARLLASDDGPFSDPAVEVFERADRIGGRLHSVTLPGLDETGELGGMRYRPDSHRIVASLVEDVFSDRLEPAPFPLGDPANHLRYLRGQRFPADAWRQAQRADDRFQTRYDLPEDAQGFSPGQLFRKVIHDVLRADPWFREAYGDRLRSTGPFEYHVDLDRREWNDVKTSLTYQFPGPHAGVPVSDLGMWTVLEDQVGHEGYEFLTDGIGYYALTANWNAAQAMADVALDFASETSFRTLAGGFDRLAYALAAAVLDAPGGAIRTRNALRSVRATPSADRRYALALEHRPSATGWTVRADHVVLAMPRRSLELLGVENLPVESEGFRRTVEAVIPQPALKLLLAFEEPWWRSELGAHSGESITDLPIRQCYYFGTNEAPDDDRSLFLASYDDERAVSYWMDAEADGAADLDALADAPGSDGHAAPERMVEEAMAQVRELHGADVPDPYAARYRNWAADPFGGGYNHWKPGVPVPDAMATMRRPDPGEHVHVVGSAYSGRQGWVEGALCTAEKTLESAFGLDRPDWLADDYYLG